MPVYRGRRDGTWRVTVFAPMPGQKTSQREWLVEGTKSDAKAFERRKQIELAVRPIAASRAALSFSDFCTEMYEPHAVAHLKDSTWSKARVYQVKDLVDFFGRTKIDRLSEPLVEEYKLHCIARRWRPGYTNAMLVALRAVLRWGRDGCQLPIPVFKIKRLPTGTRRVRAWTSDEVRGLYSASTPWLVPMLHMLLDTGLRKGEEIAAEWSWVDWDAKMLRVPVTEHWQPKNGKPREVPLSDALYHMLRTRPHGHSRYIFNNQYGVPYAFFPHEAFWEARDAAGIQGGIHTSRHTYASHFLQSTPDLALLANVLGHSTTYVTELYTHLLPEHLGRARNAVQLAPPGQGWAAPRKRAKG